MRFFDFSLPPPLRGTSLIRGRQGAPAPVQLPAKLKFEVGGSMLGEFSEEYLQEVLDPVFRHITLKTEEEMNLLSPDALYAGFLGALFGSGVESVDAAVNGLPTESTTMDSTTKDSDYAEFADILNEPEDLENFKYLASLPKAEQEAFIESLTVDALEEGKHPTAFEESDYAEFAGIFEDLEGLDYLESLNGEELENFISNLLRNLSARS